MRRDFLNPPVSDERPLGMKFMYFVWSAKRNCAPAQTLFATSFALARRGDFDETILLTFLAKKHAQAGAIASVAPGSCVPKVSRWTA
ncbi:hypothetical protein ACFQL4_19170 [Halosimplex aquaticum]